MPKKRWTTIAKGFGAKKTTNDTSETKELYLLPKKELINFLSCLRDGTELDTSTCDYPEKYLEYFSSIKPIGHARHSLTAVPVSVFHDPTRDKTLYSPMSSSDYYRNITGMRMVDENGVIVETILPPETTTGHTKANTFWFILDSLETLEEHLPDKCPTLDDIIRLGCMDEAFTPLDEDETNEVLYEMYQGCGENMEKLSRIYKLSDDGNPMVATFSFTQEDGVTKTYYQPVKTRFAWSQLAKSMPIWYDDKGRVKVETHSTSQGTHLTEFV